MQSYLLCVDQQLYSKSLRIMQSILCLYTKCSEVKHTLDEHDLLFTCHQMHGFLQLTFASGKAATGMMLLHAARS